MIENRYKAGINSRVDLLCRNRPVGTGYNLPVTPSDHFHIVKKSLFSLGVLEFLIQEMGSTSFFGNAFILRITYHTFDSPHRGDPFTHLFFTDNLYPLQRFKAKADKAVDQSDTPAALGIICHCSIDGLCNNDGNLRFRSIFRNSYRKHHYHQAKRF